MSKYVTIDFEEILEESPNALLVNIENEEVWIPRSQIEEGQKVDVGDCYGELSITQWIAEKKNLDYYEGGPE